MSNMMSNARRIDGFSCFVVSAFPEFIFFQGPGCARQPLQILPD